MPLKVELELFDAEDIISIDSTGEALKDLLSVHLSDCFKADGCLKANTASSSGIFCSCHNRGNAFEILSDDRLTQQLQSSVTRRIRVRDKYMRLLSILVKSREFYIAYPHLYEDEGEKGSLSVIDLPKTKEGRPYVPTPARGYSNHQFNLSHQHPYMGIARIDGASIGLDIVVFDEINHRLYKDEMEFVNVFRNCFAESEWDSILASKSILQEFFLQWAIKEAYTKALGLGMSCGFNTFTTKLDGVSNNLWEHVAEVAENAMGTPTLKGIVYSDGKDQPTEWWFFFHLLRSKDQEVRACACVCAGPGDGLDVEASWLGVEELLKWHQLG